MAILHVRVLQRAAGSGSGVEPSLLDLPDATARKVSQRIRTKIGQSPTQPRGTKGAADHLGACRFGWRGAGGEWPGGSPTLSLAGVSLRCLDHNGHGTESGAFPLRSGKRLLFPYRSRICDPPLSG